MNITLEKLKKTHGDKAKETFDKIARIGGWGEGSDYYDVEGGLDISSLSDAKQERIAELLGSEEKEPAKLAKKENK
jgi:hypothetical protein